MCLCYRNFEKISFSEQDEVIWRGLLLPIPSDPSLKVDVSTGRQPSLWFFQVSKTTMVAAPNLKHTCPTYEAWRWECNGFHVWWTCPLSQQVGRLQCPLLLVVGEDDQNWCSHESATDVSPSADRFCTR